MGGFEDYLVYLSDYIKAQKKWCKEQSVLYPGITGHYIYQEERECWEKALDILGSNDLDSKNEELRGEIDKSVSYLKRFSPERAKNLGKIYTLYIEKKIGHEPLIEGITKVLSDPPSGFFPEQKQAVACVGKSVFQVKPGKIDGQYLCLNPSFGSLHKTVTYLK